MIDDFYEQKVSRISGLLHKTCPLLILDSLELH